MENKATRRGRPKGSHKTLFHNPFIIKDNYPNEDEKTKLISYNILSNNLIKNKEGEIYTGIKNIRINCDNEIINKLSDSKNFKNTKHHFNCLIIFLFIIKKANGIEKFSLKKSDILKNNKDMMNEKTYNEAINWFKKEGIIAQAKTTDTKVYYYLNILKLSSNLNTPKYIKQNYPKCFDLFFSTELNNKKNTQELSDLEYPLQTIED